jgi:hypothetical protein
MTVSSFLPHFCPEFRSANKGTLHLVEKCLGNRARCCDRSEREPGDRLDIVPMNAPGRPKRNYIRRKKYLNDSAALVKSTLSFINRALGTAMSLSELDRVAEGHAMSIEAVCWDPRTNTMTDDIYHNLMAQKTRQLCLHLIFQSLPQGNALQVLSDLRALSVAPQGGQKARTPPLPLPIIKKADSNEGEPADFQVEPLPNLESFAELPRLRFDQPAELSIEPDPYHEHLKFDF